MADTSLYVLGSAVLVSLIGGISSIISSRNQKGGQVGAAKVTTEAQQQTALTAAEKTLEGQTIGHLFKELERLTGEVKENNKSIIELQARVGILEGEKIVLMQKAAQDQREWMLERSGLETQVTDLKADKKRMGDRIDFLTTCLAVNNVPMEAKVEDLPIGELERRKKEIDRKFSERFED